jgi:hypothetical protein
MLPQLSMERDSRRLFSAAAIVQGDTCNVPPHRS